MTDPNRGAYPPERPLAFDGYAPRPRGGPAPVTLILSLLVLLGVGGGVFYLYRGGARAAGGPPEPVGAPVGDLRVAAPPQAQTPDPAAGLTIFKDDPNVSAAAPAFTPPPEQPTPRPVPAAPAPVAVLYPVTPTPAQAAAVTPSSTVAILPARPPAKHVKSSSIDTILADATPTTASRRPPAADAPPSAPAAKHPAVVADAPQSPVAKHAASGSYVVQIGAFSSRALADKSWDAVAEAVPGAMAGRGKHVAEVAKADGATLYRTAITGFDTRQDAQALCAKLTAAGRTCFVR